ncbi:MAG: hypothetical protein J6Q82_00180 [Clostridia bacterium]|nr:hypothetical protein [Clostridia bacterium]
MTQKNRNETNSMRTKRLAVCAMLSALGVVILGIGSVVSVMDISMAVIASLFCVFAVIEYGGSAPWLVFLVTGILSLLLPQKAPAAMYLLFFGYYPILKEKIEKHRKSVAWVIKEAIFQVALAIMLLLYHFVFMAPGTTTPWTMYVLLALIAEIVFPIYDVALTRLITLYLFRLRKRFRIK